MARRPDPWLRSRMYRSHQRSREAARAWRTRRSRPRPGARHPPGCTSHAWTGRLRSSLPRTCPRRRSQCSSPGQSGSTCPRDQSWRWTLDRPARSLPLEDDKRTLAGLEAMACCTGRSRRPQGTRQRRRRQHTRRCQRRRPRTARQRFRSPWSQTCTAHPGSREEPPPSHMRRSPTLPPERRLKDCTSRAHAAHSPWSPSRARRRHCSRCSRPGLSGSTCPGTRGAR